MKNFEKYYDFIKDDDTKNSVKRISDKIAYVNKNFVPAITEFINPYVAELSLPLINNFDVKFELFPSFEHGERKVFVLYPDFLDKIDSGDYVTGIRIKNKSKFIILGHRDYLGSIMSLGIDRNKTGDIYVYDDYADIIVHNDISDYIIYNLDKIGNSRIESEKINIDEVSYKEQEHVLISITCSSMRLDNIVKHIINKSRETSSDMIKSGYIKVNYQVEDKGSRLVEEGDMLSVSKHGRFKISKNSGMTKSGKYKVEIKHYV